MYSGRVGVREEIPRPRSASDRRSCRVGVMLPADPARLPWNISMPPAAGRRDDAAFRPAGDSRLIQRQRIGRGLEIVRSRVAGVLAFGTSIRGPLIGITSSGKIAMFIARGSSMPSSRFRCRNLMPFQTSR